MKINSILITVHNKVEMYQYIHYTIWKNYLKNRYTILNEDYVY